MDATPSVGNTRWSSCLVVSVGGGIFLCRPARFRRPKLRQKKGTPSQDRPWLSRHAQFPMFTSLHPANGTSRKRLAQNRVHAITKSRFEYDNMIIDRMCVTIRPLNGLLHVAFLSMQSKLVGPFCDTKPRMNLCVEHQTCIPLTHIEPGNVDLRLLNPAGHQALNGVYQISNGF